MINWAYVSGFFDGEGNIDGKRPRLTIVQKPQEPLVEIARFLSTHGIHSTITHRTSQYKIKGLSYGRRNLHALRINRQKDVLQMCANMLPFLLVKKAAMQDAVRYHKLYPSLHRNVIYRREVSRNQYTVERA